MFPCSYQNHTFAVIDIGAKYYLAIQNEHEITGILGKCLDNLLCSLKNRKCRLISHNELGIKLPNNTYTGILGLLQNKQVDLLLKPEPDYFNENWLSRTLVVNTEDVVAFHIVADSKNIQYYDLSENFNFNYEFILSYCLVLFLFGLICFILNGLLIKINKNQNFYSKFIYLIKRFSIYRIPLSKIIVLFLSLFIWFTSLFISSNIKTNKVVVDKSQLIKSINELFETKKSVCFFQDNTEAAIAINLNRNSILSKLFFQKTKFRDDQFKERSIIKNDRCLLSHRVKADYMMNIVNSNFVFITSQIEMHIMSLAFAEVNMAKKIWSLNNQIHDYNTVFYYSQRNSLNDQLAKLISGPILESGLIQNVYSCMQSTAEILYEKNLRVYSEEDDYIEDNLETFSDLILKNFRSIFLVYFLICLLILIVFILSYLLNYLKKKKIF